MRFLLLSLVCVFALSAKAEEVITVSTAQELFQNIGPDRTIRLRPGTYLLTGLSQLPPTKYCKFIQEFDGPELQISDVKNFKLEGMGGKMPLLMVSPKYADVFEFDNCENITITNIRAGHGPEKGHCSGGVLAFSYCKNITIEDCNLFGCGIQGIGFYESEGLTCSNTVIEECTYHIMALMGSKDITFTDCTFRKNEKYDQILMFETSRVTFEKCKFSENHSDGSNWSDYVLFKSRNASMVKVENCTLEQNELDYKHTAGGWITFSNNKEKENTFRKGEALEE